MATIKGRRPDRHASLSLMEDGVPRAWREQLADLEAVMLDALTVISECQEAIAAGGDTAELAGRLADMTTAIRKAAALRSLWEMERRIASAAARPALRVVR